MADGDLHVLPLNDLLEHEEDGDDCPCLPHVEAVPRDDGSTGWLIVHNAWDCRQ
jgi:hypothetical protein